MDFDILKGWRRLEKQPSVVLIFLVFVKPVSYNRSYMSYLVPRDQPRLGIGTNAPSQPPRVSCTVFAMGALVSQFDSFATDMC